nr:hypothetical protein [Tanacetum cinerariifolium]
MDCQGGNSMCIPLVLLFQGILGEHGHVRVSAIEVIECGEVQGKYKKLEPGTSTSFLKFPTIKQLAIKRWDKYGFVIHPEFLCIHDNVDDLIESDLNTKLLSINSQRLDKEKQEVKNIVEQPAERGNRSIQSLQNFRVIRKSSISLNTSQISLIHAVATILSTKESEYPLSMGYEHLCITPETKSDEVTESNAKNLLPIPSECEVTLEDKREFYDDDFEDIEYVEASLSDPEIISVEEENGVEEENVVQQEEEEIDLEDISQIQDVVLREKLLSITRLISNIESLNDNSTSDHNSLFEYDSFCFEIEPDQERLINVVKSNISDDSSNDPLLEEADLFLASDNSIPPEPPDDETDAGEEIPVVMNDKDEDVDYSSFIFVMFAKVFSLLSAESEDTIFDPDNSTPDRVLNSFKSDNSLLENFSPKFETFCDHSKETRSGNTTHANYSLPEYDSFCFEIKPDQERLINLMKNDVPDNSSKDPLLEEVDLFLSDDSIPPGIENVADDPEGDIHFLEELLIDDSILYH